MYANFDDSPDEIQATEEIGCQDLELTTLETLSISYADCRPPELILIPVDDFINPVLFYASLSLPMLLRLQMTNVFRLPTFGSNLTSFQLVVDPDPDNEEESWNLSVFTQTITDLPHCKI